MTDECATNIDDRWVCATNIGDRWVCATYIGDERACATNFAAIARGSSFVLPMSIARGLQCMAVIYVGGWVDAQV